MKNVSAAFKLLPIGLAIVGGISLILLLLLEGRGANVSLRVPIAENMVRAPEETGTFVGELTTSDGVASTLPGTWPGFRGADLNGIITAELSSPLNRQWETNPPGVLWDIELGEGYAGAAVAGGRVYILDYDQEKLGDTVRCLSLDDGREIWRYFYKVKIKRNHGMSRTVPVVAGGCVITFGPKCHVVCLDAVTGELRWQRNLVYTDGAEVPAWYAGQCPLVDDERLILGVGGDEALLMALDYRMGEVIWQTPNPHDWQMTHSSVVPMDLGDEKTYVYCAGGGVVGVSAVDGRLLWEYPDWRINIANVPTPLVIDNERLFLSGGYNAGSMMLRVRRGGEGYVPEALFKLRPKVFGSDQQTPIYFDGYIYGVRPDEQLVCLDLNGEIRWTSSSANKFGLGPYTIINGLIYVMDDDGHLTVAQATPDGYTPITSAQVLEGHESWGPMAFASGRLIVRDLTRMVCLEIKEQSDDARQQ